MAEEYSFTWSTKTFYSRDGDKVTMMKAPPRPKEFAKEVVAKAPNWVKKFHMPSREITKWPKKGKW